MYLGQVAAGIHRSSPVSRALPTALEGRGDRLRGPVRFSPRHGWNGNIMGIYIYIYIMCVRVYVYMCIYIYICTHNIYIYIYIIITIWGCLGVPNFHQKTNWSIGSSFWIIWNKKPPSYGAATATSWPSSKVPKVPWGPLSSARHVQIPCILQPNLGTGVGWSTLKHRRYLEMQAESV